MSWASNRKTAYFIGVVLFFVAIIGVPILLWYVSIPQTCHDGILNQTETAVDKGGPCLVLDERYLQPYSIMWARSLLIRQNTYTAIAYIENPNPHAAVGIAHYRFRLLDADNVLITERTGTTYIMPGGITPIIETGISTEGRVVVHTRFEIVDPALVWLRASNPASNVRIVNQSVSGENVSPKIEARANNISFDSLRNIKFVAVVFDPVGNAFAASATALPQINAQETTPIGFTWPYPFPSAVGRVDIIPLLPPEADPSGAR